MRDFPKAQNILSQVRRAVDGYNMISEGDVIAVGVSGGKDSMTLLCALNELKRFYPVRYDIKAVCLDNGTPGYDPSPVVKLCEELGVELILEKTEIYSIIFEIRKESNPCSLCARMRRGALHDVCNAHGINKLALGHHYDDAIETFFMNLFNEGRVGCFSPVTYLDRKGVTVIRPLIYTAESDIRRFVKNEGIELCPKSCPADGNTDREKMKNFVALREREDHGFKKRIFGAMERGNISGFREVPKCRRTKYGSED